MLRPWLLVVSALASVAPVWAADGGTVVIPQTAFEAAIGRAREVLQRPYERETNLSIRNELLACVKREDSNADCWKLLETTFARSSRHNKADEARAEAAYKRWSELTATGEPEPHVSPMGDWDDGW